MLTPFGKVQVNFDLTIFMQIFNSTCAIFQQHFMTKESVQKSVGQCETMQDLARQLISDNVGQCETCTSLELLRQSIPRTSSVVTQSI
jgi:hypothetical protein